MKNFKNIAYGLILIALGVIFGLNALGYTQIDIFFDGWWTLIIIIPCVIGLLRGKDVWANLAGITVGSVALLICQDIITFEAVRKLIFPAILVYLGVSLVFKDVFGGKAAKRIKELNGKSPSQKGSYATFSTQNLNFAGQDFTGVDLTAAFGNVNCDLSFANVPFDCVINAYSTFGKIDITLPQNVNVVVRSSSIFGGVTKKRPFPPIQNAPTVFINATCLFGGVELK